MYRMSRARRTSASRSAQICLVNRGSNSSMRGSPLSARSPTATAPMAPPMSRADCILGKRREVLANDWSQCPVFSSPTHCTVGLQPSPKRRPVNRPTTRRTTRWGLDGRRCDKDGDGTLSDRKPGGTPVDFGTRAFDTLPLPYGTPYQSNWHSSYWSPSYQAHFCWSRAWSGV